MLFQLFSQGYFSPMATLCKTHLGPFLEGDQNLPGPTDLYNIKVVNDGECRVCGEAPLDIPRRKRLRSCVEQWSACRDGTYNPSCCRFPKECSCEAYPDENINASLLED